MDETNFYISNSEKKDVIRLFSIIFLFVPLLLFVAIVNVSIDPSGLYKKNTVKYERDEFHIAQALTSGKDVKLFREIDDRLLQKYFVEDLTFAPDIIVLGTSQTMWIGDNIFLDKKVVNNSVSDVVLADYLGIFNGYVKKGLYPKRVVILLNPMLIASPFYSQRWVSIKEGTFDMLNRLGVKTGKIRPPIIPPAWLNVFSFSYFQEAMREFNDRNSGQSYAVGGDIHDGTEFLYKDGRRLWSTELLSWSIDDSRRKTFKELYHKPYLQAGNHIKLDRELEGILENFIQYLIGHHIQVTLCLLPFHPEQYKSFLESQIKPGALDIVGLERYYRRFAERSNIEILGSYDPAYCNLGDKDFYDGDHIRNEVIERMLKQKGSNCSMPGI